jgi:hypothetical protein
MAVVAAPEPIVVAIGAAAGWVFTVTGEPAIGVQAVLIAVSATSKPTAQIDFQFIFNLIIPPGRIER